MSSLGGVVVVLGVIMLCKLYVQDYLKAKSEKHSQPPVFFKGDSATKDPNKRRFLVVTASDGGGHLTAARYWTNRLQVEEEDVECIDIIPFTSLSTQLFFRWWPYIAMYIPELHACMHWFSQSDIGVSWLKTFAKRLATELSRVVTKPTDVIVCHPLAAASVNILSSSVWKGVRVVIVQTDFFINSNGWNPLNEEYHLPRSIVPLFRPTASIRTKLGFKALLPMVLVTVGSTGLLPPEKMYKIVRVLDRVSKSLEVQFVCATGTNVTLKEELEKLKNPFVKALPQQVDLVSLLPQFDAVLVKASGMTCVEILAAKVPFAIWYSWRGQEKFNTKVLKKQNLAVYLGDSEANIRRWLAITLPL